MAALTKWRTLLLALASCPAAAMAAVAHAPLVNEAGAAIGEAVFRQARAGVLIVVRARDLPHGLHGIHLHHTGKCAPNFAAAGGHINPNGAAHGLLHPDGPDNGDLPNLHAAADGTAHAEFYTTRVRIGGEAEAAESDANGLPPALLDGDGSAVIIHANPDDHLTQPIGGAAGRIACGVVRERVAID